MTRRRAPAASAALDDPRPSSPGTPAASGGRPAGRPCTRRRRRRARRARPSGDGDIRGAPVDAVGRGRAGTRAVHSPDVEAAVDQGGQDRGTGGARGAEDDVRARLCGHGPTIREHCSHCK